MRKVGLEAGQGKVWLVNANFGLGLHLGVAVRKAGKEAGMGKTVLQLWVCVWQRGLLCARLAKSQTGTSHASNCLHPGVW